jgi:membrane protein implicated in regulation of membrane protease activity
MLSSDVVSGLPSSDRSARGAERMIVLAHTGHWAVQLLYLAPLVVLVWMLVAARLRERREREAADRSSD